MHILGDIMTPDPVTIPASTPVRVALEHFEGGSLRHLPVVEDDRIIGILSDRDVRPWRRALLDELEGEATPLAEEILSRPVSTIMTPDVVYLSPERPITDAIDVMLDFRIGAVPVVTDGRLVGIVSYVDLLELLKNELLATV